MTAIQIALMISLCGSPCSAGIPETPSPDGGLHLERIRSSSARIDASLRDGYQRSGTFRMLVDTLEHAEVFVYITPGRCRPMDGQKLAGCLVSFGVARGVHQLRVIVDVGLATDHLIVTLGHELQHAVEISQVDMHESDDGAPRPVAPRRVRSYVNETDAAERISRAIRSELREISDR